METYTYPVVKMLLEESLHIKEGKIEVDDQIIMVWDIEMSLEKHGSPKEKDLIRLYHEGYDWGEIADIWEDTLKNVYYCRRVLVKKLVKKLNGPNL